MIYQLLLVDIIGDFGSLFVAWLLYVHPQCWLFAMRFLLLRMRMPRRPQPLFTQIVTAQGEGMHRRYGWYLWSAAYDDESSCCGHIESRVYAIFGLGGEITLRLLLVCRLRRNPCCNRPRASFVASLQGTIVSPMCPLFGESSISSRLAMLGAFLKPAHSQFNRIRPRAAALISITIEIKSRAWSVRFKSTTCIVGLPRPRPFACNVYPRTIACS